MGPCARHIEGLERFLRNRLISLADEALRNFIDNFKLISVFFSFFQVRNSINSRSTSSAVQNCVAPETVCGKTLQGFLISLSFFIIPEKTLLSPAMHSQSQQRLIFMLSAAQIRLLVEHKLAAM